MARVKAYLLEVFSCFSRLLNALRGGTADITLSAASHIDELWTESVIDALFYVLTLGREKNHCRIWWEWEVERSRANVARFEANR